MQTEKLNREYFSEQLKGKILLSKIVSKSFFKSAKKRTMCNFNYGLRSRDSNRPPNYNPWPISDEDETDHSSDSDPDYERGRPRKRRSQPRNGVEIVDMEVDNSGGNSDQPAARRAGGGRSATMRRRRRRRKYSLITRRNEAGPSNRNMNVELSAKRTILSWMIDMKVVEENAIVLYRNREGRDGATLMGEIKRDGILCGCCKEVVTVGMFQVHAGGESMVPFANICLAGSYFSLLHCQIQALQKDEQAIPHGLNFVGPQPNSSDGHDDVCFICADGGSLLCCSSCPSTVHFTCLEMEGFPQGDWQCPYCVCKLCGGIEGDLQRCIQCQKRFHWGCFIETADLDLNRPSSPFCGNICKMIFKDLQKLVGKKNELGDGFSWSLLRRMPLKPGSPEANQRVESNSKLAVAWRVMDECFMTNIDRHTRINVVQSVVYQRPSNLARMNFSGFYTAVLEKDEEIICAASIRVHDRNIADMPFMATREIHRMQGMARKLHTAIESILHSLRVKRLIIPSVSDLVDMWTDKYQFSIVDQKLMKQLLNLNILMFPGTVRMQKTLLSMEEEPVAETAEVVRMEEDEVNQNLSRAFLFDLNLEPPDENDEMMMMM